MNIELGILNDGRLTIVSDAPLPDVIKRVEFYREQRLFQIVYKNITQDDQLMECEISEELAIPVEKSPDITVFTLFEGLEPLAYKVPLIKVGALY